MNSSAINTFIIIVCLRGTESLSPLRGRGCAKKRRMKSSYGLRKKARPVFSGGLKFLFVWRKQNGLRTHQPPPWKIVGERTFFFSTSSKGLGLNCIQDCLLYDYYSSKHFSLSLLWLLVIRSLSAPSTSLRTSP